MAPAAVWTLPLGYVGRVLGYSPVRSPGAGQALGRHGPGEGLPVPFHFLTAHSSHVWAMCPQLGWECAREGPCSLPPSLLAALALALQLSCFPLILTPFRAAEALNRRSEHHLMRMKKANEKAQGNQITSPMSDSECVALSEIVQQSPTCCPYLVFLISSKSLLSFLAKISISFILTLASCKCSYSLISKTYYL